MGNIVKPFKQQPSSFAYQPLTVPLIPVEAQSENLRVFSFKEWMKATKKSRQDRVVIRDDHYIRSFYKGYIDNTTFAPSRTKTGTPVSVVEYLHGSSQALQEWVDIFGVILLELLVGSQDRSTALKNQSSDWTGSFLPDNYKIGEIIDPRIGSDYPVDAATKIVTLIQRCTNRDKKKRPLMQEVLDALNYIAGIRS
ncbi:unnamed protein product [Arabidopsis thaliana]|uniref:At5g11360 n=2 Tax=Arabidopsis thaliana TaxID=3702 RepID=A6QRB5_ARATH|nr:Interleukin-1 receptor-associated kinase 4 protein [Arabidopsis thaliana]ABR46218.1 At5g11360 [Arabidopsis thaliana]AED91667.1 Interleukin-1 receptor-associated kinase 4 protein [Arabidopsis thaliana]CAD5331411.1 unnamed protein product [Arabidopsis thaliana]|eukprot:NP_001154708.1 Interleukin-1 receptor-associated kinase 4 protein [Arabidopsis thaliana]